MKYSTNYKYKLPEGKDELSPKPFNENFEGIDLKLYSLENKVITGDDIENGAVTPEKTSFCQFDSTPKKIGTWINGTPIWRVAFDENISYDDTVWKDKCWTPIIPGNQVTETVLGDFFFLQGVAFLKIGSSPDYMSHMTSFNGSIFKWTADNVNNQYSGIYGFVDFVTPESNIII